MHACAPWSVIGISSPSGKVRSTMNRAIWFAPSLVCDRVAALGSQRRRGPQPGGCGKRLSQCSIRVLNSGQPGRDLDPRIEAELVQDVVDVVVDRALRQVEARGDVAVAETVRHQPRHLVLAAAQ